MNHLRPAKVLIIHPYTHVGGPDTFITNIARGLIPKGFELHLAVPKVRPFLEPLKELGVSVIVVPGIQTIPRTLAPHRAFKYIYEMLRARRQIKEWVRKNSIQIVHGVNETMWPFLVGLSRLSLGRIISIHGMQFGSPAVAGYVNSQLLYWNTDRIICVSKAVKNLLLHWHVPNERMTLIPSSVDLNRFAKNITGDAFRRELGIENNCLLVGTVGSVDERKGHRYFLEACAILRKEFSSIQFLIVGVPDQVAPPRQLEYVRRLHALAADLGLDDRLRFLPTRTDIPEVLSALDVLIQPSLTEAAPRAPLEAMAMERPVVATDVGGTSEVVRNGITGLLVKAEDSVALAQATGDLLRDATRRRQMGEAGRADVVKYYSLTRTAELLGDLYSGAAGMIGR